MISRKKAAFAVMCFSLFSWLIHSYLNRDKGNIVKFTKFFRTPLFTDHLL